MTRFNISLITLLNERSLFQWFTARWIPKNLGRALPLLWRREKGAPKRKGICTRLLMEMGWEPERRREGREEAESKAQFLPPGFKTSTT